MKKYQVNSPCCLAKVSRFGSRRRQCVLCKKTWRIRRKKTGRKRKVINKELVIEFLEHSIPIQKALALKKGVSRSTIQRDISLSLDYFLKQTPWPIVSIKGDLIVVADAMVVYKHKQWHTWYFILVRLITDNEAIIMPPYHRVGTEVVKGWHEAFCQLPETLLTRTQALVCDGHAGLVFEGKLRHWLIQRCHFHLIARIQSRRSKWKSSQHFEEGKRIYGLVKIILTTKNRSDLVKKLSIVKNIGQNIKSKHLKTVLLGFVRHVEDFRTFLNHPNLHLPTTNNTAESLIGYIQSVSKRAKGFRTITSMNKWIYATIKYKKKIVCNGFHQPS